MRNRVFFVFLVACSVLGLVCDGFAQGIEVENKLPKSVPLKIEFAGQNHENWWYDLEIKVTNTGKKPIYFLSMFLLTDVEINGSPFGFTVEFGDYERLYAERADPSDPAILPGEFRILQIVKRQADAWDLGTRTGKRIPDPNRADLELQWLNFGDGTSIEGGGTTVRKKSGSGWKEM